MSHFLFINPSAHRFKGTTSVALTVPPIGLAYLAAALEARGHSAQIIDANLLRLDPEDVSRHVVHRPDVIGISANILTAKMAVLYGNALKVFYPQAKFIFGGPYASVYPRKLLDEMPTLDAVIVGEGEETVVAMADALGRGVSFDGIPGVVFRQGTGIVDNGLRALIENVDVLPVPAYHLLPNLSLYRSRGRAFPVGYIFTSRGCPAACTFCYRTFGAKWRARSPEKVIEEIEFLVKNYGIRQLDILDDNFAFDPQRARIILEKIIEKRWNLKINLQIGVRVQSLSLDLLKVMRKAGVFKFGFGIESGDEMILKRIKKGLQLDKAVEIVGQARSLGMVTHGYFIIGFPGDTPESMQRTIDFAKRLDPHYASFSVCTPIPGTEMFDDIVQNGVLLEDVTAGIDEGLFALKPLFKYGDLEPKEVAYFCEKAWREFYARPGKILDVVKTVRSFGEALWLTRVVREMFHVTRKAT